MAAVNTLGQVADELGVVVWGSQAHEVVPVHHASEIHARDEERAARKETAKFIRLFSEYAFCRVQRSSAPILRCPCRATMYLYLKYEP